MPNLFSEERFSRFTVISCLFFLFVLYVGIGHNSPISDPPPISALHMFVASLRRVHVYLLLMHMTACLGSSALVARFVMPISEISCIVTKRLAVAGNIFFDVRNQLY